MKLLKLLFFCSVLIGCNRLPEFRPRMRMAYHFDKPATIWEERFPLGNGRIGLMPDGGVGKENIVLNEISMWSGSKQYTDNPKAQASLGKIRDLLFAGRNDEAQALMYETFVCHGEGSGRGDGANKPYGSYQIFGNLELDFSADDTDITDYRRELDIEKALATVSYQKGETSYSREYFTSFASDVAVIRLKADNGGKLQCRVGMNRPERYEVTTENQDITLRGRLYEGDVYKDKEQLAREEAARRRQAALNKIWHEADSVVSEEVKKPGAYDGKGVRYASRVRVKK